MPETHQQRIRRQAAANYRQHVAPVMEQYQQHELSYPEAQEAYAKRKRPETDRNLLP